MGIPAPRQLWLMQLRLECKQLDSDGWMVRSPGDDPDAIPDCALTRFSSFDSYYELTFSRSASVALREEIRQLDPAVFFDGGDVADDFLAAHRLELLRCSTYRFAEPAPRRDGPAEIVRRGPESFAAVVDGQAVAWATSARSNDECAELWVYTDPARQRRGYASQVATAWANAVTCGGRVAFYSHLAENEPSRLLARSLGVIHLFDLAALTAK